MKIHKDVVFVFLIGVTIIGICLLSSPGSAKAAGETCSNGSAAPCAEDYQLDGCTICHSIRITAGNRDGTDRIITAATGVQRHIDDPLMADWTSIIQSMTNKGAPSTPGTTGYLNTNYCTGCTGPILGSPKLSFISTSGAALTWSTSYIGFEDEPADTVLFYGTDQTDVLNCINLAGCPGVSVVQDSSLVAHHVANLSGLSEKTQYYVVNQATSSHGTVRSLYAVSFRTRVCTRVAPPPEIFLSNNPTASGTETPSIVVIDSGSQTQLASIPVNGSPGELVAHPNGQTVYATVDSNLTVIDALGNTELTTLIGAGGLFNHVAMSPDGNRLYLAYRKSTGSATLQVKVFDTSDPSIPALTTIIGDPIFDGCYGPLGLGVKPDGSQLYLACRPADSSLPDRFYMIDTTTNTPSQTATFSRDKSNYTFINAMAVKPDGSAVYLARSNNDRSTVEIFNATGLHTGTIPLPNNALPRAAAVTPDGSKLYVVDQRLGTHVINTATNTLLLTMPKTKSRGFDIAIHPFGPAYTTLLSSVFVLETSTDTWTTTITGEFTAATQIIVTPLINPCAS
jgi:DNA-binding beta-propeller fold protein YncE